MSLTDAIKRIAQIDIFEKDKSGTPRTGIFVGRPFYLDFDRCNILVADDWKQKAKGIPQGCFLLAYYENEANVSEAVLLRVLKPCTLPTDSSVISSMIEYYKDNLKTAGAESNLDVYTRYEFGFSGIECRVLGTFYRDEKNKTHFGADVENFYSAHNYRVFKPNAETLEVLVNYTGDQITGTDSHIKIGKVRYSSSTRFQENEQSVPVFVTPKDFLGKRTALFGMTRTGKSNTVKKIIEASVDMSKKAPKKLTDAAKENVEEVLDAFTREEKPKYPVGQIIFDVNGEYANRNLQDSGTAIFEIFKDITERYSVLEKPDFKVMKVNFYKDILTGFELARIFLKEDGADYVKSFNSIDMTPPEDENKLGSAWCRYDRLIAAYLCSLHRARFPFRKDFKVKFRGADAINQQVREGGLDPNKGNGISLDDACIWFEWVWDNYEKDSYFTKYKTENGEWANEDLKAALVFLTCKRTPGKAANASGYKKLRGLIQQHTEAEESPFKTEIISHLRNGKIVIVDLSQGEETLQKMYSEMICRAIFHEAMGRFVANTPNNFIQFYFEEAHNLFPKKEDADNSQIYNRIAKEGAKLNIGLIYATQEASSISGNILKNTQNWFIAHLNNSDEIKEIRKFYDFSDFADGLIRFSAENDKGFIRMKTYSNPFVVPVQVDRFQAIAAPEKTKSP